MIDAVIESYTCSKTGRERDNEDGIFLNENFIAVIDGATSKTKLRIGEKTGGQFIRDVIMDTLGETVSNASCRETVADIMRAIREASGGLIDEPASASAIIYSRALKQIWAVGDCQAYIGDRLITNFKLVDRILSEARAMAENALIETGEDYSELLRNDEGRRMIMPFLKLQHVFENKGGRYGYCVFNLSSDPETVGELAKVYEVPEGEMVVLASDGYPVLKNTLAASEKELARLLAEDPLMCREALSTKGLREGNISFDDRTYIRFIAI